LNTNHKIESVTKRKVRSFRMACRKWYMGTNTKMYKTIAETNEFVSRLCELTSDISREAFELFVIPSFTTLEQANRHRNSELLKLGAQNMCWEERGQYTGEISPLMLQEVGCDLVMIGHSERRYIFLETDDMERRKVRCAVDHGFKVLLCIGETEEEKDAGKSDEVLKRQLKIGLVDIKPEETGNIWVAYEPVWAIGVHGKPITIEYADDKLHFVREVLIELFGKYGKDIPIFYGGSVNPENAEALSQCKDINGLFIGRSAWDADDFNKLIRTVLKKRQVG
jgi:triosephosphate isomerase